MPWKSRGRALRYIQSWPPLPWWLINVNISQCALASVEYQPALHTHDPCVQYCKSLSLSLVLSSWLYPFLSVIHLLSVAALAHSHIHLHTHSLTLSPHSHTHTIPHWIHLPLSPSVAAHCSPFIMSASQTTYLTVPVSAFNNATLFQSVWQLNDKWALSKSRLPPRLPSHHMGPCQKTFRNQTKYDI